MCFRKPKAHLLLGSSFYKNVVRETSVYACRDFNYTRLSFSSIGKIKKAPNLGPLSRLNSLFNKLPANATQISFRRGMKRKPQ